MGSPCKLLPFGREEEVKMDPKIFESVCKQLAFIPEVDLFASEAHKQLNCYMTADPRYSRAIGCNAFNYKLDRKYRLYANPPWSLISRVVTKIWEDKARVMMVTPTWRRAPWYEMLREMTVLGIIWEDPFYLDEAGKMRPKPNCDTRISLVDGGAI